MNMFCFGIVWWLDQGVEEVARRLCLISENTEIRPSVAIGQILNGYCLLTRAALRKYSNPVSKHQTRRIDGRLLIHAYVYDETYYKLFITLHYCVWLYIGKWSFCFKSSDHTLSYSATLCIREWGFTANKLDFGFEQKSICRGANIQL